jgi:hypothetical protein
MSDDQQIRILELWTRDSCHRKIGNGPWEKVDLSMFPYHPVIFFDTNVDWTVTETLTSRKEVQLKGLLKA